MGDGMGELYPGGGAAGGTDGDVPRTICSNCGAHFTGGCFRALSSGAGAKRNFFLTHKLPWFLVWQLRKGVYF